MNTTPVCLRVEHLDEAIGITEQRPRLSWQLPDGAPAQTAYRIRSGGWDSGRVESDRHLFVPWAGPTARSGTRVDWQVKVWTDDAVESGWSRPGWWEWGLLSPADWAAARWIEPAETEVPVPGHRPAYILEHDFILPLPAVRARLYATAHGVYEVYLNGSRAGDLELTPGFTSYHHRLQVQTYDVTELVCEGANTLGALLSDGWYRG